MPNGPYFFTCNQADTIKISVIKWRRQMRNNTKNLILVLRNLLCCCHNQ